MIIINEAYERVQTAIEDIKAGCEVMDDFHEWEDIASSSINSVLEELDGEQFDMTCRAFIEWIKDNADSKNLAYGVKAAFVRAMDESMDYMDLMDRNDDPTVEIMKRAKAAAERLFKEETA